MEENIRTMDRNWSVRLRNIMVIFLILFVILLFSFFYTQIINGRKLKIEARNQQLLKKRIGAKRGQILDRNGEVLAQSFDVDTVTLNPKLLKAKKDKEINKDELANKISEIFGEDKKETLYKLDSKRNVETLASKVSKDKINDFKKYLEEKEIVAGINIDKDIKRDYPHKTVAANLIGFVGADNEGQEGIEKKLNSVLMGREGRIISESDVFNNPINETPEQLINPEDGKNVYLTIDIKIQEMIERHLKQVVEDNKARDGIAIVMNPKDASILAIANYPTYDLSNPRGPVGMDEKKWKELSDQEQLERLFSAWKTKAVSDIYDPGSTFKILTSAIAIEEGLAETDKAGDFLCTGVQKVYDRDIKCWRSYNPHGYLSLRGAMENSCNPAFIQVGQRIGVSRFYKYLRAFGLLEKTNIDILGESSPIFHGEKKTGPVELATMSFGERFQITPIQLITAISAIANGGELMKPQIVHKIENVEIGSQEVMEGEKVRRVVSKDTSAKVLDLMRSTVTNGTGKAANIPGYNVGGKSGTSEPVYGDPNGEYIASFVAVVPTESPEYVVLMIVRNPKAGHIHGGQVAGPVVGEILKELLSNSQNIAKEEPKKVAEEKVENIAVPDVKNLSVQEAKTKLQEIGLSVSVKSVTTPDEIKITKQIPETGLSLPRGSKVYLTTGEDKETPKTKMPDIKGKTKKVAEKLLIDAGLTPIITGNGSVQTQDIKEGTELEKGTIVRVEVKN